MASFGHFRGLSQLKARTNIKTTRNHGHHHPHLEKDEKKSWNKSKCYEKQQIGSKEFGIGVEGEETKDSIYLSIDKTRLHLRSLFLSEPQCQASLEWWSCGDDEDEDEDRTKTIWASFFIVTSTISLSSSLSLF